MGKRRTNLMGSDRTYVDELIEQAITANGVPNRTHGGAQIMQILQQLFKRRDQRAVRAVWALAQDGAEARYSDYLKQDRAKIMISRTGQVLSMPARFGIRTKKKLGKHQVWQQPLWWELSWEDFEELVENLRQQGTRLEQEVEALGEVLTLRERFPGSATPLEACEAAGIDPRSFKIDAA